MARTGYAIEVKDLTKVFGNRRVLRGINLNIEHGEAVVIFGPNGAGKTTFMKLLATVASPTSGTILVNGLDLKKEPELIRRTLGTISHQTYLYGNLTAYENLEFYGKMYDVPGLKQRVLEILDMVGLTTRMHDRVATFSRGMQQRVSIARALIHKPSILLLDEPETGLDQEATAILWRSLRLENEQRTLVITSHNLERGLSLADRLIILDKGKIAYECPKSDTDLQGLASTYRKCTGVTA